MLTPYLAANHVAAFVIAHGAGAGQSSPFMTKFARGMVERGISAATFDFPYMRDRRKVPDKALVLEDCWREAIAAAKKELGDVPLFIGGKSMGGRIASQVAAGEHAPIAGLIYLGYPLHPPGKPQQLRDAHLPKIAKPMLFVQGSRDAFGTIEEIRALLPRLQSATIFEVTGGDHSFKVSGRGRTPEQVMAEVMDAVAAWIRNGVNESHRGPQTAERGSKA
jgi:predicted alpha/beta-hydrolase family hydrolase